MYKTPLNLALLFAPAACFAAELIFIINDSGYYLIDGAAGLVPLAVCLIAARLQTRKLPDLLPRPIPGAAEGVIFAAAAAAKLISLCPVISDFGSNSGIQGVSYAVLDGLHLLCGLCAAACLFCMSASSFKRRIPSVGILAAPAALAFLLDLASYFVYDPINSGNAASQRIAVSFSLVALFAVKFFYNAAEGKDQIPKITMFWGLAALGYCAPGLIQALILKAPVIDVLPCLVYTFLTLTGFTLFTDSENQNA